MRTYPNGKLASHVLGYTGTISEAELKKQSAGVSYESGDIVGKDGAEQTGTDDQIIILHFSSPFLRCYANAAQFAAGTQNRGHPWQAGSRG